MNTMQPDNVNTDTALPLRDTSDLHINEIFSADVVEHPENLIPNNHDGIHAIVDLAQKAAFFGIVDVKTTGLGAGLPDSVPLLKDDKNGSLKNIVHELEAYRIAPKARKGVAKVNTLESFIALTNRHKDAGSAIFAQTTWPDPSLTAVINYHDIENTPRYMNHRIKYEFPITPEFNTWIKNNQEPMAQIDFATFLEEHSAELAEPTDIEKRDFEKLFKERFATPNELVDLSRSLEIYVGSKVKQGVRLSSGERTIEFKEEHSGANGERIEIPGLFIISIAAFMDSEPVRILARLRYKMPSGEVKWMYQLYRWELDLRERIQSNLEHVAQKTQLPCFEGTPEV
jgi:uncharacterized protein YfdQ (DUF2303 family)